MFRHSAHRRLGQRWGAEAERYNRPKSATKFVSNIELLEPRRLLYSTTGGAWPHPELITVSFMPDGSDIAGVPSALFSTLNAKWATATWQKEILKSLQSWAANSNLNFSIATDDGSPFGSAGLTGTDNNMQGDSNFGDIRIGAFAAAPYLGLGMLPPPINGDTTAGDFFLDVTTNWSITSDFNLFTVSAHEAGHGLGLDHSTYSTAVMYDTYNGTKSSLTSDDVAGIQAIYGARAQDSLDAAASNNTRQTATVITPDGNKQVTLTSVDITTTSDLDWYKITVPSGSTSTITVQMQSTSLSLLIPKVSLYSSGGSLLKSVTGTTYNSTISLSRSVSVGSTYYIKAEGADTTVFGTGSYALQVNLGTQPLPPVYGPNTATPSTGPGGIGDGLVVGPAREHRRSDRVVASSIVTDTADFEGGVWSGNESVTRSIWEDRESVLSQQPLGRLPVAVDFVVAAEVRSGTNGDVDGSAAAIDHLLAADLVDTILPGYDFASELAGAEAAAADGAAE